MGNNVTFRKERYGYSKWEVDTYVQMLQQGIMEIEKEKNKAQEILIEKEKEMQEVVQQLATKLERYKKKEDETSCIIMKIESEKKELIKQIEELENAMKKNRVNLNRKRKKGSNWIPIMDNNSTRRENAYETV